MTQKIRLLDEAVINRIAAGEVVERPASVVKELLDNSIDAAAGSIRIDIEKGGSKLVRVRDDGCGMSRDDCLLSLERHATSKLTSEADLVRISTLGFRGEALAGIASVSRLTLLSYDGKAEEGTHIRVEGGTIRAVEPIGMGKGTVIEVRDLFFNTPVRRKFLKSHKVEAGHIEEFVTNVVLAFPGVGFVYAEDGRVKMDVPPTSSTFERVRMLYSKDVCENLSEVDYEVDEVRLHGYVARPPYARSNSKAVLPFVNGRAVRDRLIGAAISRALANMTERGRYPLAILFLDLPRDCVDVNVHPQKAEVRFVHPQKVFDVILNGIHKAICGAPFGPPPGYREPIFPLSPVSSMARHLSEPKSDEPEQPYPVVPAAREPAAPRQTQPEVTGEGGKRAPSPQIQTEFLRVVPGKFESLGIVGSLPGSFVILHSDDELIVLDHHAAHERILFEDLRRADAHRGVVEAQELLIPKVLEFSALEARTLASVLDVLQRIGFRVEEFGEASFVVKAVPTPCDRADLDVLFGDLVRGMLETGHHGDPEARKDQLLKNLACKAAAKESKKLHVEEIRSLLRDLDRVGSIEVCPHGRPITARFPLKEIRKKLGRS
ncbi:MAG: DNA mismatch repair endonuclease MutL [Thermodesulfobacteriota bacterium]